MQYTHGVSAINSQFRAKSSGSPISLFIPVNNSDLIPLIN